MPHRYFTTEISDGTATLRGADAHHLARVMRARLGDTVILCDGNAVEYTATITGFGDECVEFRVEPGYPSAAEPSVEVTLLAGYPKQDKLEQIIKQLNKLLHVLKIVELDPNSTVERELVLIKVAANESNRSDVLEIVRLFRVRVVDVNPESLTIEATGAEGKIDALLGLLEHYGVIELVRSGAVAVTRGPRALSEKVVGSEVTGR